MFELIISEALNMPLKCSSEGKTFQQPILANRIKDVVFYTCLGLTPRIQSCYARYLSSLCTTFWSDPLELDNMT